jgi:hypothetical protein
MSTRYSLVIMCTNAAATAAHARSVVQCSVGGALTAAPHSQPEQRAQIAPGRLASPSR